MRQEISLVNPHDGVLWNKHLEWLTQHHPAAVRILYSTGDLFSHLDLFVAAVTAYRGGLQRTGLDRDAAELVIFERILCQELRDVASDAPLDPALVEKIREEILAMEDVVRVIEV